MSIPVVHRTERRGLSSVYGTVTVFAGTDARKLQMSTASLSEERSHIPTVAFHPPVRPLAAFNGSSMAFGRMNDMASTRAR